MTTEQKLFPNPWQIPNIEKLVEASWENILNNKKENKELKKWLKPKKKPKSLM